MKTKKTRVYFKHYKDSDLVRYAYLVGAKLTQSETHIRTDWSAIPQDIIDYTIRRDSEYLRDKRIKYKDVSDRPNNPIFYLIEWSSNRHMDIKCLACGGTMSYNGEYYECSACGYTQCRKGCCDENK